MGCIPSKEPTSETPLLNNRVETLKQDSKNGGKSGGKPELHRRNTLDRIDTYNGSYDDMGNYKYKRWCGVRRSSCLLIIYIVFYAVFILFGAIIMMVLEEDNLQNLKIEAVKFKNEFINKNNVSETDLEEFISAVLDLQSSGVSMLNEDVRKQEWMFGESILFAVTLLTTIGYGHMTPITDIGKFFVIAYAIVGLPLTMVLLAACVQKLEGPMLKLIYILEYRCRCCESRLSTFCVKFIHLVILTLAFWTFIMILPAFVFWFLEPGWDLMDASYFVFISVTTIGLGDLVPGSDGLENKYIKNAYQICVSVYLLISLVMVSLTGIAFYDIPQLNLGEHLSEHRDIYLSDSQLCGNDKEEQENGERSSK